MNQNCLLTIGIPVFNGEKFVRQTLESLTVAMTEILPSYVEILISDNCSTDKTVSIVSEFNNIGRLDIKLLLNKENAGYDRNIDLIAENASGKYIWFLGCGEIVKSSAIKSILQKLNENELVCVFLNFDIYSEITGKLSPAGLFPIQTDRIVHSIGDVYSLGNGIGAALSSNIVSKHAWKEVLGYNLMENGWCHVERVLRILSRKTQGNILLVAQPCFTLYQELDGWWSTNKVFINFISYCRIFRKIGLEPGMSDFTSIFSRLYPFALLSSIVSAKKSYVSFSWPMINSAMVEFKHYISFWLFVLPVILAPGCLFRNRNFDTLVQLCTSIFKTIRTK